MKSVQQIYLFNPQSVAHYEYNFAPCIYISTDFINICTLYLPLLSTLFSFLPNPSFFPTFYLITVFIKLFVLSFFLIVIYSSFPVAFSFILFIIIYIKFISFSFSRNYSTPPFWVIESFCIQI
jgi:hypothetical protein